MNEGTLLKHSYHHRRYHGCAEVARECDRDDLDYTTRRGGEVRECNFVLLRYSETWSARGASSLPVTAIFVHRRGTSNDLTCNDLPGSTGTGYYGEQR
jgi:hypothetical protein